MRSWLPALVLLTLACDLHAQPPGRTPPGRPWASREYLTAAALVHPDTSLAQVEILFRCSATSLVALRSGDPSAPYLRTGELTIELFDSTGTSRAREIDRVELAAQNPDTSEFPLRWIERRCSFRIPPGRYNVRAELLDLHSGNRILRDAPLIAPPLRGDSLHILPVFFTLGNDRAGGDSLRPQNYGDGLLFAAPGSLLLYLPNIDSAARTAEVVVRFLVMEPGEKVATLLREEKYAAVQLQRGRTLSPSGAIHYTLRRAPGRTRGAFLLLPLPLDQLPLRRYRIELDITAGSRHATATVNAVMLWPDQPESLRDVEYALESLRFITTGRILDSLQSGDFARRRENLEGFWKDRDATPVTADNPLMTEYYRRIDHARGYFATLKQQDGTRTDRGKIYILNGPPARTDRSLDPVNGFSETWTYSRKRFVFLDKNRDGNYTLVVSGGQ